MLTLIVLDPYLLNVCPRSLISTVLYIATLVALGWPLSGLIFDWLEQVASKASSESEESAKSKKDD
jgi:hypothetical protein